MGRGYSSSAFFICHKNKFLLLYFNVYFEMRFLLPSRALGRFSFIFILIPRSKNFLFKRRKNG